MAFKDLTPLERAIAQEVMEQLKQEQIDKTETAEGLDDAIEDTADELLLWCANKPYSRWIVAFILGLTFYAGWLAANNHLAIIHWVRETTGF